MIIPVCMLINYFSPPRKVHTFLVPLGELYKREVVEVVEEVEVEMCVCVWFVCVSCVCCLCVCVML